MLDNDYRLQVSIKGPHGEMVNIRATDTAELDALLTAMALRQQVVAELARDYAAGTGPAKMTGQPQRQTPAQPAQGWTGTPQPGDAPACQHGPRVYREGVSKAGKPFKVWSCTADRAHECPPMWVD
jgi:hypothetical protein